MMMPKAGMQSFLFRIISRSAPSPCQIIIRRPISRKNYHATPYQKSHQEPRLPAKSMLNEIPHGNVTNSVTNLA